jgi:hypothetical protein
MYTYKIFSDFKHIRKNVRYNYFVHKNTIDRSTVMLSTQLLHNGL